MRLGTGVAVDPSKQAERRARRKLLELQTAHVADALERRNVQVRLPSDLVCVGEVTGNVEDVESLRAIRILPLIAQRDRRPMLASLGWFLDQHSDPQSIRYAVVTSGQRVPVGGDLRARMKAHTATVCAWSKEAEDLYGVELLHRATEYTLADAGAHLHSNLTYRLKRRLSKADWAKFLMWSRATLGCVWKECGVLKDVREVVKYQFKPAELLAASDETIFWLYEQTFHARQMTPHGSFKAHVARSKRLHLKYVWVPMGPPDDKGFAEKLICPVVKETKKKRESTRDKSAKAENVLVARTLPVARWGNYAEPTSLVLGYTQTPTTEAGENGLHLLAMRRAESRGWWDANGAPDPGVTVHKGSLKNPGPLERAKDNSEIRRMAWEGRHLLDVTTGEVTYTRNFEPFRWCHDPSEPPVTDEDSEPFSFQFEEEPEKQRSELFSSEEVD